jgi:hypothetical protein
MSPCCFSCFDTKSIIAFLFLDDVDCVLVTFHSFSGPVDQKTSCLSVLETPAVALHCTMPRAKREGIRPHQGNNTPGFLALKPGLGFVGLPPDSGRYQAPLFLIVALRASSLLDLDSLHCDAVRESCSV